MSWNFDVFELSNWKITLPVDSDYFDDPGADYTDGTAVEVKGDEFEGFEAAEFFYYDDDEEAMIFRAPADGAKTSANTTYARSELREMDGDDNAAWSLSEGGTLSATLKVTELAKEDDGDAGRVVIGQIHGEDDELVRLYYDANGELYFANEITDDDNVDDSEVKFYFENSSGESANVALGETFSYNIDVSDEKLTVEVSIDGEVYSAVETDGIDPSNIVDAWSDDSFYFKAGVYQGVNNQDGHSSEGTGAAEAAFYDIDFDHEDGKRSDGLLSESASTLDTIAPVNQVDAGAAGERTKGGAGQDTFVFSEMDSVDTIADFSKSDGDIIDISAILAEASGFSQSDVLLGGFVEVTQDGSDTSVYIDLDGANGSGSRSHILTLEGEAASGLDASNFLLV